MIEDDKIYITKDDLIIIKPKIHNIVPADCPICKLAIRNLNDVIVYKTWGCCGICCEHFAYPNKEIWENGWRPSKEEINRVSYL